jgi:LPXTG-motif cell wall-anchored protein
VNKGMKTTVCAASSGAFLAMAITAAGLGANVAHAADISVTQPTSGTVPAGVCYADLAANGGSGYDANPGPVDAESGNPGFGADLTARFPVTAGETYSITFAKGGAAGPDLGVGNTGGAGGDAAAIAFSGVVHLAAGGGGGAGGISTLTLSQQGASGGTAGALSGSNLRPGDFGMNAFFPDSFYPNQGQGGKATGAGGQGHPDASPGGSGTSAPGAIGNGGAGGAGDPGSLVTPSGPGGGGGGAGYDTGAGGGGGANNAAGDGFDGNFAGGGGGGNSFIEGSNSTFTTGLVGFSTHTASASITWIACPAATTTTVTTTTVTTTTAPTTSAPTTSAPDTSAPDTTAPGEPGPTTTGIGSGSGGPRTLPSTGSTVPTLMLWSTIVLIAGTVLLVRSKRPA